MTHNVLDTHPTTQTETPEVGIDVKRMRFLSPQKIGLTQNLAALAVAGDRLSGWLADRGHSSRMFRASARPQNSFSEVIVAVAPPLSREAYAELGKAMVSGELLPELHPAGIDVARQGLEVIDNIGWVAEHAYDKGPALRGVTTEGTGPVPRDSVVATSLAYMSQRAYDEANLLAS